MTAYSLRRRLILWLLLATVLIGLAALFDTWREALRTAQGVSDRVLAGSALAIAERVTVDEKGGLDVDIPYSSLEMLTSTAQDRVFYRVDGPVGSFLTGYENLRPVPAGAEGTGFADGTFEGIHIRSATVLRRVSTGSESLAFSVTVAETTLAREALARDILLRSALRLMVMILSVAGIVWLAVTLALRPLDRLGESIAQRSSDDLRPVTAHTPQEVEPLLGAINSFMQRLETALAGLRHFTGNASHQLRTPLAVARTQMALVQRSPDPAQAREALGKADAALVRAERVLAQLLVLARVDAAAGTQVLAPTDIAALTRALTSEMVPEALRCGIDLGYEGAETALAWAEPVLFAEMLRNLLDNAIAYAGEGALVTVRVLVEEHSVLVAVEDNGPGLSPEKLASLAARPMRGPVAAIARPQGTSSGGYGLGLAIVAEISRLFTAEFSVGPAPDAAGFACTIRFARLPSPRV